MSAALRCCNLDSIAFAWSENIRVKRRERIRENLALSRRLQLTVATCVCDAMTSWRRYVTLTHSRTLRWRHKCEATTIPPSYSWECCILHVARVAEADVIERSVYLRLTARPTTRSWAVHLNTNRPLRLRLKLLQTVPTFSSECHSTHVRASSLNVSRLHLRQSTADVCYCDPGLIASRAFAD